MAANERKVRRCAIYTRKSSEHGLEQDFNSLDAQREAGEAYIKRQAHEGWRLVKARYDDGGISGGTLERPALQLLLADIRAGKIDVVVAYKVDRLTRSLADFAKLVELFEAHGVSFVAVTQQFNTTTSMGRLTLNVLLSFAQFERELASERIRDKFAASRRKGMWMGGTVPLGYEVKARKLVINPEEAERALVKRPMAFNQDIKALVSRSGLSGSFIRSAIYHAKNRLLSRIVPSAHGTMTLNLDDIENLSILVPTDAAEAEVIASVLDLVQQAISIEKRQLKSAIDFKRIAMRDLFSRGLRGEAQKETEFGLVPGSWLVVPLDHCAKVQTGVAKGRKFANTEMIDVPYLRVANVQDGHLDLTEMKTIHIRRSEVERYKLQTGDVVLTEGGDFDKLGRGFIWRGELDLCVHQNHVFAVRPNRSRIIPEYFAYLAQSAYGKAYFLQVAHKTTNLACINSTKLKAFPVLIPSVDEQFEIVAILDAIDRKIDLHTRKRALLEDLFKALLHKLMTGEIRVADLNLSGLRLDAGREAAA